MQYQVLYQLTLSVADTVAFCLDGSTFSIIQASHSCSDDLRSVSIAPKQ